MSTLSLRSFLLNLSFLWLLWVSTVRSKVVEFLPQSFYFDWNLENQTIPIPVTEQCQSIHIKWSRGPATGPNPNAPYYLQIYTSAYLTPFIIPAGNGPSFDWAVPFAPGTQYQICMFDKFGNTGGCQATYTVIPPTTRPSCANVTFPPTLDVHGYVLNGPWSQFGWIDQCTDLSLFPQNGTPPYTLTIAPALHPPYNITSNDAPLNWTVSLSWASPFFVSLADANGNLWASGPLHSGGGGSIACLAGDTENGKSVKPFVAITSGVGSLVVGLVVGGLIAWLVLRRKFKKKLFSARFAGSGLGSSAISDDQYRPLPAASSLGLLPRSASGSTSRGYQIEPFQMPDEDGRLHNTPVSISHGSGSAYTPSVSVEPGSPPAPPRQLARTPTNPSPRSHQVYVVHHDSQSPPVTIYHQEGTQIVELPPRYPPTALPSLEEQVGTSASTSDSPSDLSGRRDRRPLSLHEARQPSSIQKPPPS